MASQQILTHDIKKIFECRGDNSLFVRELEPYCNGRTYPSKTQYSEQMIKIMSDITHSLSSGINPNDTMIMSSLRGELNKINSSNYQDILTVLKKINYTGEVHFSMLANELIMKSMNDILAVRGMDSNRNQMTPSEMYAKIALEFFNFFIEDGKNEKVRFKIVFLNLCKSYFNDFVDPRLRMDQNNQHRVNNYKGLMNMIGLLYSIKCFNKEIVIKCMESITRVIIKEELSIDENDNYYSGYGRLINQILSRFEKSFEKSFDDNEIDEFKVVCGAMDQFNKQINDSKHLIRKFSSMIHIQNMMRLHKLNELCVKK
jgi:hypothetical protein